MSQKAVIFLATGFEEVEAITVIDYLRRAEITVEMWSITEDLVVKGAHGVEIRAERSLMETLQVQDYDIVILPGGMPGSTNLRDHKKVIQTLQEFSQKGKYVAAMCAAPIALEKAGLLQGKKGTSYPGVEGSLSYAEYQEELVVQDGHLITSRAPGTTVYFALKIIEALKGEAMSQKIKDDILLSFVEAKIKSN